MSDPQDPKAERPTPWGAEGATPITPPRPQSRNAFIIAVAALVMAGIVFIVAAGVYMAVISARGAQPSVRVVLRVQRPTRFEFRIHHFESDLSQVEAKVRSALASPELPATKVRVWVPSAGRLVIESSAPDEEALAAQAALLTRRLESLHYRPELASQRIEESTSRQVADLLRAIERRLRDMGSRARVTADPSGRIVARIWGAGDAQQVAKALTPVSLDFAHIPRQYTPDMERDPQTGRDTVRFTDRSDKEVASEKVLAESQVIARGSDLKSNAHVTFDPTDRSPLVAFEFRPEAADRFYEFTRTHKGHYLAIVLDGEIISTPIVQAAIKSKGVIQGGFASARDAQDLANLLNASPLPLEVEVESVRPGGRGTSAPPHSRDKSVARTSRER